VQLAVVVEADRAVRVGEQGFEIVEVAADLAVDDRQALGVKNATPVPAVVLTISPGRPST